MVKMSLKKKTKRNALGLSVPEYDEPIYTDPFEHHEDNEPNKPCIDPYAGIDETVILDDVKILKAEINNSSIANSSFYNSKYFQRGKVTTNRLNEMSGVSVIFPVPMDDVPHVLITFNFTFEGLSGLHNVPGPNATAPYIIFPNYSVGSISKTGFTLYYYTLRMNFGDVVGDHYALAKAETDQTAAHRESIEMFYELSKQIDFFWLAIV